MAYTWRAAALDFWKDPAGGNADQYWVQGYHYYMANNGNRVFDTYTQSSDCGGYNGWWDKEKARGGIKHEESNIINITGINKYCFS